MKNKSTNAFLIVSAFAILLYSYYLTKETTSEKLIFPKTQINSVSFAKISKKKQLSIGLQKIAPREVISTLERTPAAIPDTEKNEIDLRVAEFLKTKSKQNWTLEKNGTQIEKIFGGKINNLVNTDEKLIQFIGELTSAMGYGDIRFAENKLAEKKSNYEVINEFQQSIDNTEIYGAYFRSFRDSDNLSASFFINEFKKYDKVINQELYTLSEIEAKIDSYYNRLGKTITDHNCSKKVYYVENEAIANLAYRCIIKTSAQLSETFEVLVSTANADVLFQKRITIFN